jgi:hypothetical protein
MSQAANALGVAVVLAAHWVSACLPSSINEMTGSMDADVRHVCTQPAPWCGSAARHDVGAGRAAIPYRNNSVCEFNEHIHKTIYTDHWKQPALAISLIAAAAVFALITVVLAMCTTRRYLKRCAEHDERRAQRHASSTSASAAASVKELSGRHSVGGGSKDGSQDDGHIQTGACEAQHWSSGGHQVERVVAEAVRLPSPDVHTPHLVAATLQPPPDVRTAPHFRRLPRSRSI